MVSIHFAMDTHSDLIGFSKDVLQGNPLGFHRTPIRISLTPFQTFRNVYPLELTSILFMYYARDTPYDFIGFPYIREGVS